MKYVIGDEAVCIDIVTAGNDQFFTLSNQFIISSILYNKLNSEQQMVLYPEILEGKLKVITISSNCIRSLNKQLLAGTNIYDAASIHIAKRHNACMLVNSPYWQDSSSNNTGIPILYYNNFGFLCSTINDRSYNESRSGNTPVFGKDVCTQKLLTQ